MYSLVVMGTPDVISVGPYYDHVPACCRRAALSVCLVRTPLCDRVWRTGRNFLPEEASPYGPHNSKKGPYLKKKQTTKNIKLRCPKQRCENSIGKKFPTKF